MQTWPRSGLIIALLILTNSFTALAESGNSVSPDRLHTVVDSVNGTEHSFIVSHVKQCISLFEQNVEDARSIDYVVGEAAALMKLALALGMNGQYEQSTEYNLRAIRIYEDNGMLEELAAAYGDFGFGLKRRDLKSGKRYMLKGIGIAQQNKFKVALNRLYDNYGALLEYGGDADSAEVMYTKSLNMKKEIGDTYGIPYSLNKLMGLSALRGDFENAWRMLDLSDSLRNLEKEDYGRAENRILRADFLAFLKRYDEAIVYYEEALELNLKLDLPRAIQYCYERLSWVNEELKQYEKALSYYWKSTAWKDSLVNTETNERMAELQIAYETEKKDREIAEKETELGKRARIQFATLAILVLVVMSLLFSYRFSRMKQARLRAEMELASQQQKQEMEQKIHREKTRISKELHDNVGSNLSYLINSLDNLEVMSRRGSLDNQDVLEQKLATLGEFGREAISDLRTSIWVLGREKGDLGELCLKLQDLKTRLNASMVSPQIILKQNLNVDRELSSSQMLQYYRLIQEALQNAIRHARAEHITLSIQSDSSGLLLEISDDGRGFDLSEHSNEGTHGNGLDNMRLRCEEAGAGFEMQSNSGGTCIRCRKNAG